MSRRATAAGSERIDRVSRGRRSNVGLEPIAVHDVDGTVEQSGDIVPDRDIFVDAHTRRWVYLDHDVGVAVGSLVAPRPRAEQGRVRDAAGAQRCLVLPQPADDGFTIHNTQRNANGALPLTPRCPARPWSSNTRSAAPRRDARSGGWRGLRPLLR